MGGLRRAMKFRCCIDLHQGKVKQIVGSTLSDTQDDATVVNFESEKSSADFAALYQRDGLTGGHVIMLGPGNEEAAIAALQAYPGGLQVGGGINPSNAIKYLEAGATHVIVTSFVFVDGALDMERLTELVELVTPARLVLDLSCRRRGDAWYVVTDRWQRFTDLEINKQTLSMLEGYCSEFLVHGVDVEGKQCGIEEQLVSLLGEHCSIPVTYAGGAKSIDDFELVKTLGKGKVDLTIGSALDVFGGKLPYEDVVRWSNCQCDSTAGAAGEVAEDALN